MKIAMREGALKEVMDREGGKRGVGVVDHA